MTEFALVIETPETCDYMECPLCVVDYKTGEYICTRTMQNVGEYFRRNKPDWCPLIPIIGYVTPDGHMVSWEGQKC